MCNYFMTLHLTETKNTLKETIYGLCLGIQFRIQSLTEHQEVLWTCCYTNKRNLLPVS